MEAAASYLQLVSKGEASVCQKQVASLVLANVGDPATLSSLVGKPGTEAVWTQLMEGVLDFGLSQYSSWGELDDKQMLALSTVGSGGAEDRCRSVTGGGGGMMAPASWTWSSELRDATGFQTLTQDGLCADKTGHDNDYSIICGAEGWESGKHTWELQIDGDTSGVWVGACTKPQRFSCRLDRARDCRATSWHWRPSGEKRQTIWDGSSGQEAQNGLNGSVSFLQGQTIRFSLDCDAETLQLSALSASGAEEDMGTLTGVKGGPIYPAVCFDYNTQGTLLARMDESSAAAGGSMLELAPLGGLLCATMQLAGAKQRPDADNELSKEELDAIGGEYSDAQLASTGWSSEQIARLRSSQAAQAEQQGLRVLADACLERTLQHVGRTVELLLSPLHRDRSQAWLQAALNRSLLKPAVRSVS